MKAKLCVSGIACAIALSSAGGVFAGPAVSVTFKNNSTDAVTYHSVGANGASTKINASPIPGDRVEAGGADNFRVQSRISRDANFATLQYETGSKVCRFSTTYMKAMNKGVVLPKWTKNAEGSGGASCDVRILSVNYATHEWAVEFVMR
jgi:hypothetical protein